jgi:hypothetical protein
MKRMGPMIFPAAQNTKSTPFAVVCFVRPAKFAATNVQVMIIATPNMVCIRAHAVKPS